MKVICVVSAVGGMVQPTVDATVTAFRDRASNEIVLQCETHLVTGGSDMSAVRFTREEAHALFYAVGLELGLSL